MRKSAKQQVEEILMVRYERYMTHVLLERGISLSKQVSYIERIKRENYGKNKKNDRNFI